MPPLALLPSRPVGAPDIVSTGYGAGMGPASASGASDVQTWEKYLADIREAMKEAAGFERIKLERQYEDAAKARDNAMAMARLQAETSRYGTDVGRQNLLAQLEQNDRQFQQNHALEQQKLGLSRAQTATEYLASPDRYAQAGNFLALSGRVLAGQPGAGTFGRAVTPRGNTLDDFAVLESGGNPNAGRGSAVAAAGSGGAGADARVKAITDLMKASPPSSSLGLDQNDYAVLNASRAIMNMNLTPQQQASVNSSPAYKAILGSNLRNLGEMPDDWFARQRQSLPGQGAARRA